VYEKRDVLSRCQVRNDPVKSSPRRGGAGRVNLWLIVIA